MAPVKWPQLRCSLCAAPPASPLAFRCACGGPFEYDWAPRFEPDAIRREIWSQWRYDEALLPPGLPRSARISLGEGMTPLVSAPWDGSPVFFKLEFMMPTGSYKDRGSATLVSVLRAEGHRAVIDDSSGNAGASLAAYAAAAGIEATIFVPAHASPAKKAQIVAFGAQIREIAGPRHAVREACERAAGEVLYASHAAHPAFLLGQMAGAWEIWEQTGGRVPDAIVIPVGQGAMLLGYARGFRALLEARLTSALPRLIAVQSSACAPLVRAFEHDEAQVAPVSERPTTAEGIRVRAPIRGEAMLRAVRESGGFCVAVDDGAISDAQDALARRGLFVERTSAAAAAALSTVQARLGRDAHIVVPLSGSGLKDSA